MPGKMNESVFNDLMAMGFDGDQSRKAAMSFSDAQLAIDWILSGAIESDLPSQGVRDWPMQGPSNIPTRTNTPHRVETPLQPSPTVSDFGDASPRNDFIPKGMSEEQALQAAIEASQSGFDQQRTPQHNPPSKPRVPAKSIATEYAPPPGPPPLNASSSSSTRARDIDRRGTRSPTPGPPGLERRREGSVQRGPVVGSNNPFRKSMGPPLPDRGVVENPARNTWKPEEEQTDNGNDNVITVQGTTSGKNVHFPPSVVPASLTGSQGSASGGLRRVDDQVRDDEGMRGLVVVQPAHTADGQDTDMTDVQKPAGSSSTSVTLHKGRADSPPPNMDTYPTDSDEENAALERAIKASLSSGPPSTHTTTRDVVRMDEESRVDRAINVDRDVTMTDGDVQAAAEALSDWRQNEDDDDVVPFRQAGAPLAVRSKMANSVWAAHVIQALISIPAIRRAVENIDPTDDRLVDFREIERDILDFLTQLVQAQNDNSKEYTNVTLKLDHFGLTAASTYLTSPTYEMVRMLRLLDPAPSGANAQSLEPAVIDIGITEPSKEEEIGIIPEGAPSPIKEDAVPSTPKESVPTEPERNLLISYVNPSNDDLRTPQDLCWIMEHDPARSKTVSDTIAAFFQGSNEGSGFTRLSDVFCIAMKKADRRHGQSGGEVSVELEESIYMDRFMIENKDQINILSQDQKILKERIVAGKEAIEKLTKHKGQEIEKMIDRTMKHYEGEYGPTGSEEAIRTIRTATITQLQAVKETLAAKRDELAASLKEDELKLAALWDRPELRRNKYYLHGVCFNSGWSGMNAIRSYVKGTGDQWWRFRETIVEKTTFGELATDNWGLMFDQGPFFLVYTRAADNPPPKTFAREPAQGSRQEASAEIGVGLADPDVSKKDSASVNVETAPSPMVQSDEPEKSSAPTEDLLGLDTVADEPVIVVKPKEAM